MLISRLAIRRRQVPFVSGFRGVSEVTRFFLLLFLFSFSPALLVSFALFANFPLFWSLVKACSFFIVFLTFISPIPGVVRPVSQTAGPLGVFGGWLEWRLVGLVGVRKRKEPADGALVGAVELGVARVERVLRTENERRMVGCH